MAVSFSSISGLWTSYPEWASAFQACLEHSVLHGCQLFKHPWDILSCTAVSFSAIYPAWLPAFQASLGFLILHGCELFNHLRNNLEPLKHVSMGHPILHGYEFQKNHWNTYSSFSSISGILSLHGCELFNFTHLWDILSCVAVNFSSIFGTSYSTWL